MVLPLLYPALGGGALLTFMTSLASFSAPYIFGGGFRVMTTQIVATRLNGDNELAMIETVSLTLIALVALWLLRGRVFRQRRRAAARAWRRRWCRCAAAWRRLVLGLLGWGLALLLLLPHLDSAAGFVRAGGDLDHRAAASGVYLAQLSDPGRGSGPGPAAAQQPLARDRSHRGGGGHRGCGRSPVGAPAGAGPAEPSKRCWRCPGRCREPSLPLPSPPPSASGLRWPGVSFWWGPSGSFRLAYLVRNLPITSRAILAGFRALDPSLDEAAATLGAGRWRTLRRVTLPLLRPAMVAGASLAFVTAFGDFVTSIMLYTYDTRPISLEILSSLRQSDVGVAAAYGVVLMAVSAACSRWAPNGGAADDRASAPGRASSAGWRCSSP